MLRLRLFITLLTLLLVSPQFSNLAAEQLPGGIRWQTNDTSPVFASPRAKKGGTYRSYMMSFPLTFRHVGPDSNGSFASVIRSQNLSLVGIHPNTEEVLPELAMKAFNFKFYSSIMSRNFSLERMDRYRENWAQPGAATAMINWYRAIRHSGLNPEDFENMPNLSTPTLMIWGECDAALGVELSYGTDEIVDDFTVRYLPDVSHWVQQEAPEAVNEILEAWLLGKPVPGNAMSSEELASQR